MKIVKHDTFRSEGTTVDKNDDMVRVVIDLTKREFNNLKTLKPDFLLKQEAVIPDEDAFVKSIKDRVFPAQWDTASSEYIAAIAYRQFCLLLNTKAVLECLECHNTDITEFIVAPVMYMCNKCNHHWFKG